MMESVYATVFPLIEGNIVQEFNFVAFLYVVASLPSLFVGGGIGKLTSKFGKKNVAYYATIISSFLLLSLIVSKNPYYIILMVFLSNLFEALAIPSISATVADYLVETKKYDTLVIGIHDVASNIGFIWGRLMRVICWRGIIILQSCLIRVIRSFINITSVFDP